MKPIDKIGYKMILLVLLLLNIFIGSNIKQQIWIIQSIVSTFSVIYILIKKIQKEKNVIIKGKIDIVVLIFMISTAIPYIFHTYVTLDGTINFILKYWSIYGFYILTRNVVTDKERINGIEKTLIISSIIPILIGYDKLTINKLEPILDKINSVKIEDTRMISIFGYANTFAVYLSLITSLAIGQFIKGDKKEKILYGIYILLSAITILLTQSKMVLALIAFIILLFIIYGIKKKKIPLKYTILGVIIIALFVTYVFIAKEIGKPLVVTEKEKTCVLRGFEKNAQYEFSFDLSTETDKDYNSFEIYIVEVTRYFSEKTLGKIELSKYSGIKTINIETTENIDHIELRIKNNLGQKLTINELKINGKPYILEYKYILEPIVRVFTTFNFKNSSVWQRGDYWRDSLKIIKDKWLLGGGGNTWRYSYGQVQDYLYYAKECHSYVLEVMMSFGVIGTISYIIIIAMSIKNGAKLKNEILSILVGTSIIVIHSLMDFDMSYLIIEMIFFMFVAIINKEDKKEFNINMVETVIVIPMLVVAVGNILGLIATMVNDETGIKKSNIAPWVLEHQYSKIKYMYENEIFDENTIQSVEKFIKNEPYCSQRFMYSMLNYCNLQDDDIKFLINTWKKIKIERPYDIENVRKRSDVMLEIAKKTTNVNLKNDIAEIIKLEYKKYSKIFLDNVRNRQTDLISRYEFGYYTEDFREAVSILDSG